MKKEMMSCIKIPNFHHLIFIHIERSPVKNIK